MRKTYVIFYNILNKYRFFYLQFQYHFEKLQSLDLSTLEHPTINVPYSGLITQKRQG